MTLHTGLFPVQVVPLCTVEHDVIPRRLIRLDQRCGLHRGFRSLFWRCQLSPHMLLAKGFDNYLHRNAEIWRCHHICVAALHTGVIVAETPKVWETIRTKINRRKLG